MSQDKTGQTEGPDEGQPKLNPGDDAPPGTPGTGEDVCPKCSGRGRLGAEACPECGGSGVVIKGLAGG
jgi:DnaJ-class molecular chaperone